MNLPRTELSGELCSELGPLWKRQKTSEDGAASPSSRAKIFISEGAPSRTASVGEKRSLTKEFGSRMSLLEQQEPLVTMHVLVVLFKKIWVRSASLPGTHRCCKMR